MNAGTTSMGASTMEFVVCASRFTGKERDAETGLDYFGARYFSAAQGRFTSADKPFADQKVTDPQSWNLYAYTRNSPLRYIDVDGRVRRDADGQIIFTPRGKVDRNFTNGDSRKGQMQPGYIQADNGKRIEAYQQVGGSPAYQCDCHGLTFADGKYWVNNDQVPGLLKGDGYDRVKKGEAGQVGDVAIFKSGGEVVYSTTVTGVDADGKVTEVSGLGGTEPRAHSDSPESIQRSFGDLIKAPVTVEYYRDSNPDRPISEKVDRAKTFKKPEDR